MADDIEPQLSARERVDRRLGISAPPARVTGGVTAGAPELQAPMSPRESVDQRLAQLPAPPESRSAVSSGFQIGLQTVPQLTDYAIAMGAGMVGAKDTQQEYIKAAQQRGAEMQKYTRPELELAPWDEGWKLSNLPSQIAYQAAKNVPLALATLPVGGVVGGALTKAGINVLPKFAATPLAGAAEGLLGRRVTEGAVQAGARNAAGITAASYPSSAGSVYEQQVEKGDLSPRGAAISAGVALPHAMFEAAELGQMKSIFGRGLPSAGQAKGALNWLKSSLTGAAKAGAEGGISELGAETGQNILEQSLRTDRTLAEKAKTVVDGAFMGLIGGVGLGTGAHVAGRVLGQTKQVDPNQLTTPDLDQIVGAALNPQTPQQRLDGNVEAMTAPGAAPAQRQEPTIGPTSGMPQGAPGPNEVAVEVSPMDRIQGGVEPTPPAQVRPNVAPEQPSVAPGQIEIPQVEQPPLSTARASAPQPNAPLAHIENAQLEQMFRQAPNEQVKAQIRKEMEARLQPTPTAPTQASPQQQLIDQFKLTGQAAKEAQSLDIRHPLEAMGLVQAKIANSKRQTLSALQTRMNELYGLVDENRQPVSTDDLQNALAREQLMAETAPDQFVREDAETRAGAINQQLQNRAAVQTYVDQAAQRAAEQPIISQGQEQAAPAPTQPFAPSKAEIKRASAEALKSAESQVPSRFEAQFGRGFFSAVTDPNASEPKGRYEAQGFEAGRAYVEKNQQTQQPTLQNAPEQTSSVFESEQPVTPPIQPAAPTPETPNAVPEQGPAGLYVREPAQAGGPVGEGNAQGGEAAGAQVGQVAAGQAPEITERPTRAPEQELINQAVPPKPGEGFVGRTQADKETSSLAAKMQRAEAYSTTQWNQFERFGGVIPTYSDLVRSTTARDSVEAQITGTMIEPLDKFSQLMQRSPKSAQRIQRIMNETRNGLDARKPWAAHTWLRDKPDIAEYQKRHREIRQAWIDIQRAGHDKIYNDLVAQNELAMQLTTIAWTANELDVQFRNNKALPPAFQQRLQRLDPVATYLSSSATRDLASARQHFDRIAEQLQKLAQDYISQYPNDINAPELDKALKELNRQVEETRQVPYFHLGRSGNHSVFFELPVVDGLADKAAAEKVVAALSKEGFSDFEISPLGGDPKVYLLVQNEDQRNAIAKVLRQMVAEGAVTRYADGPVYSVGQHNAAPQVLQAVIERYNAAQETDPDNAAEYARSARILQKYAGDMLTSNNARKSLIRRKNIEGFSKNMAGSMAEDTERRVRMITRLLGTPAVMRSITSMRAQAKNAQDPSSPDYKNRDLISNIASQRHRFEIENGLVEPNPYVTAATSLNYTANMGLNISSGLVQIFSVFQTLAPTLMMRPGIGFVEAYRAIGTATAPSLKLMNSIVQDVTQERTFRQWFDATLRTRAIEKSGLSAEQKQFMILFNNTYGPSTSSLAHELGHLYNEHEYGLSWKTGLGTAQKMATAVVYYSELFSRVVAALAAYESYKGDKTSPEGLRKVVDYAGEVTNRAMYNMSPSNRSQLMSRSGPLKELAPLAGAFMSFQAALSESLLLNTGRALGMDNYANPEQQKAARRFMAGYVATSITLAGVLGLPLVNALAPLWDKLMDEFAPDEQPHDIRMWVVKFIGDMTGSVVDDATARKITRALVEGVPAAGGVSLQSRLGNQDIFPFTRTVIDSNKPAKDIMKDVVMRTAGSPIETIMGLVEGVLQMIDGEIESGVRSIGRTPAKNTIDWWRMLEDGKYRDAQGKVLPIKNATTADAYLRLLGLKPTALAEYEMERSAVERREAPLKQESAKIVNQLALARQNHDSEAYNKYAKQAHEYKARTGDDLIERGEKLYKRRQTELAQARRTGTPLRAPKKDRGLQEATEGIRRLRETP